MNSVSPVLGSKGASLKDRILKPLVGPAMAIGLGATTLLNPNAMTELHAEEPRPLVQDSSSLVETNFPNKNSVIKINSESNEEFIKKLNNTIDKATSAGVLKDPEDFPELNGDGKPQFDIQTNKLKINHKAYERYRQDLINTALRFKSYNDFGEFLSDIYRMKVGGFITNTERDSLVEHAMKNPDSAYEIAGKAYEGFKNGDDPKLVLNWLKDQLSLYNKLTSTK